ncbi:hypothetical protein SUGI_0550190 [Cryptomeria japonica]|nr:hypothetical protein SUGI_0550190 [Cryptomeria japonica]
MTECSGRLWNGFWGRIFLKSEHWYRSNIDIALTFMAWGLELESKEEVLREMCECVKSEWCGDMLIILAIAEPRVGLWAHHRDWRQFGYVKTSMQPFLVWSMFGNKDER